MDEDEQTLQTMVSYYRDKCNKLEHDFLRFKINAQSVIQQLQEQLSDKQQSSGTGAGEADSVGKNEKK